MNNHSARLLSAYILLAVAASSPSIHALSKKESKEAGALLFRDKGCSYCHGLAGQGTEKAPSLANVGKTRKPAEIANQIQNGGKTMPAFKTALTPDELSNVIAYLRAKHRPVPPPPPVYAPLSNPDQ
jgi:mono/diheme cytochrome c family protein